MTEHDAQQVLLVRAIERQPASSTWTDEDRLHASQEALRQTGPEAERSTFVIERARLACERLIARKPALGDLLHSLQWRGWFTPVALLEDLRTELKRLLDAPETEIETSLLVCPRMLADFLEFNDFLDMAEALLTELDLHGTVQIASFHPHYQFAGTAVDDIENATNQSPWPTLHLLRETSIDRAVAAWGEDTDRIFENNIARLQALGPEGWRRLSRQRRESAPESPDEKPPSVG